MLKTILLLNEMRPNVRLKRMLQQLAAKMEGEKKQRQILRELHRLQLQKPEYKINQ